MLLIDMQFEKKKQFSEFGLKARNSIEFFGSYFCLCWNTSSQLIGLLIVWTTRTETRYITREREIVLKLSEKPLEFQLSKGNFHLSSSVGTT